MSSERVCDGFLVSFDYEGHNAIVSDKHEWHNNDVQPISINGAYSNKHIRLRELANRSKL